MSARLFRGKFFGVFTGANGYYCAAMAKDGQSHYQPANGGNGWSETARENATATAQERESESNASETTGNGGES